MSHTVQSMIRHSLNTHYRQKVSLKDLETILIDIGEVKSAKVIFGPHRLGLKGWNTLKSPKRVSSERVHIPREYYKLNKFLTIDADVIFVAGVPFL